MEISTRTPEGWFNRCPICKHELRIEPSMLTHDAPCPKCGHLLWFVSHEQIAPVFDESTISPRIEFVELPDEIEIPDNVVEMMPQSVMQENQVFPLSNSTGQLVVALANPFDIERIDKLCFILNRDIRVVYVSAEWIQRQIRKRY